MQSTSGTDTGGFATNFVDISSPLAPGGTGDATNNFTDVGGATNRRGRYYRIRLGP